MSVCLGHVRAEDGAAAAVLPVVERREPEPPLQVERRRAREREKLAERHRPARVSWVARGDARPSACVVVVALEYVEPCIEARSRLHPSCRDKRREGVRAQRAQKETQQSCDAQSLKCERRFPTPTSPRRRAALILPIPKLVIFRSRKGSETSNADFSNQLQKPYKHEDSYHRYLRL